MHAGLFSIKVLGQKPGYPKKSACHSSACPSHVPCISLMLHVFFVFFYKVHSAEV